MAKPAGSGCRNYGFPWNHLSGKPLSGLAGSVRRSGRQAGPPSRPAQPPAGRTPHWRRGPRAAATCDCATGAAFCAPERKNTDEAAALRPLCAARRSGRGRGRVGGRHRLLRSHDGRAKIARQWRPQLWHGRRQLGVVRRQPVQSFRLRHAIHVVKLGLLVGPAPLRLQRPHQRTEHGDRQAAGEDGQRASVQSRDWARLGAQRHRLRRHLRRLRGGKVGVSSWLMVSSSAPRHRCARSAPRRRHRHPGAVRPRRTADPRCSTASGNGSSPVARRPARR